MGKRNREYLSREDFENQYICNPHGLKYPCPPLLPQEVKLILKQRRQHKEVCGTDEEWNLLRALWSLPKKQKKARVNRWAALSPGRRKAHHSIPPGGRGHDQPVAPRISRIPQSSDCRARWFFPDDPGCLELWVLLSLPSLSVRLPFCGPHECLCVFVTACSCMSALLPFNNLLSGIAVL